MSPTSLSPEGQVPWGQKDPCSRKFPKPEASPYSNMGWGGSDKSISPLIPSAPPR